VSYGHRPYHGSISRKPDPKLASLGAFLRGEGPCPPNPHPAPTAKQCACGAPIPSTATQCKDCAYAPTDEPRDDAEEC
jgi:hypothetical protein